MRYKIIDKKKITHCPTCNSNLVKYNFLDWNSLNYTICKNCGGHYQNPRVYISYEENYWGEIIDPDGKKRVLGNERKSKIKNWYEKAINYVNNLNPGSILDIGAGLGFFLSAIDSSWSRYAQDNSKYSLKFINENYPDIKTCNDDIYDIQYADNTFDVIMLYHVIEHVDDPNKTLKKIYNLLKPKGTLIVGTPNIHSLVSKLYKGKFRHYGPPHINLFSPSNLTDILNNNGFHILEKEFPFWGTDYARISNIVKAFIPIGLSPPFYGNVLT